MEGARQRVAKQSKQAKGLGMASALAREIKAIMNDVSREGKVSSVSSYAMNKKLTRHRMAKSNRVFAHLRWR